MKRQAYTTLPILVLLLRLLPSAAQAQADANKARLADIEEGLALRCEAASELLVTAGRLEYESLRTDDGKVWPRRLNSAASLYYRQATDFVAETSWTAIRLAGQRWDDRLSFMYQTATRREEASLCLGLPTSPQIRDAAPRSDGRYYLSTLGLARPDGSSLLRYVDEVRWSGDARIRGRQCELVGSPDSGLWLAPELGYAPLRQIQRSGKAKEHLHCTDWWGYRRAGPLKLPGFMMMRDLEADGTGYRMAQLVLIIVDVAAVGYEEVAPLDPPQWHVPLLVGAFVNRADRLPGEPAPQFGFDAHDLFEVAEFTDGATWGMSVKEFWEDLALALPVEPAAKAATDRQP